MPYPAKEAFTADELTFSVRKLFAIAILMASMAGYINSAMLIEFGLPVSQMTGVTSRLSEAIGHFDLAALAIPIMILSGFLFGAFLSGLMIGRAQFKTTAYYGHALLLNSGVLAAATALSTLHSELSLWLAAVACGLQNALVASYRGQQMRTTHMTGTVTDLGVHLAHKVKSGGPWPWQANLLLTLLISFLVGGILGLFAYQGYPHIALGLPSLITGLLGLLYLKSYYRKQPDAGS